MLDSIIKQISEESIVSAKAIERQVLRECEDSSGIHEDITDSEPEIRQKPLDFGDDGFLPESDEITAPLDRKRNRVVRKLSLRKSKSNKYLTEQKSNELSQNKPLLSLKDHKQVRIENSYSRVNLT